MLLWYRYDWCYKLCWKKNKLKFNIVASEFNAVEHHYNVIKIVLKVPKKYRKNIFNDLRFIKFMEQNSINSCGLDIRLTKIIKLIMRDIAILIIQKKVREYIYRPGGRIFLNAKEHFNSLI